VSIWVGIRIVVLLIKGTKKVTRPVLAIIALLYGIVFILVFHAVISSINSLDEWIFIIFIIFVIAIVWWAIKRIIYRVKNRDKEIDKPRKAWIAALLTLVTAGLGHLYADNPKRGMILFTIGLSLNIVFNIFAFVAAPHIVFIILFLIGIFAFYVFCIIDAMSIAKRKKENYELAKYNIWFVYVGYVVILFFVSTGITPSPIHSSEMYWDPMKPTILGGDFCLVNPFIYGIKVPLLRETIISVTEPKRNDIVAVDDIDYIGRVIGVGGDKIEIKDKKLFINDTEYCHINFSSTNSTDTIRKNIIFVMHNGFCSSNGLNFKDLKGKVFMIYWSWDRDKHKPRWERIGLYLK
jgi:signal peptidase I